MKLFENRLTDIVIFGGVLAYILVGIHRGNDSWQAFFGVIIGALATMRAAYWTIDKQFEHHRESEEAEYHRALTALRAELTINIELAREHDLKLIRFEDSAWIAFRKHGARLPAETFDDLMRGYAFAVMHTATLPLELQRTGFGAHLLNSANGALTNFRKALAAVDPLNPNVRSPS